MAWLLAKHISCRKGPMNMYTPDLSEFMKRAERGNLVPVYREIVADLETPISAFLKLRATNGGFAFLLESVTGGENIARYSYLATNAYRLFHSKGDQVTTVTNGAEKIETLPRGQDPLDKLRELLSEYQYVPLPDWERFSGGAVGYIGYDMVRFFEELPDTNRDDLDLPDCYFMFTDTIVVFDHVLNRVRVLANAQIQGDPQTAYWEATERIEAVIDALRQPVEQRSPPAIKGGIPDALSALQSTMTRAEHRAAVRRAKQYITAGDIIQVVLAHRMSAKISVDSFDLYRALRAINPSPYMFYLSFGDLKIIGASPEVLVTEDKGEIITRPIAGTRRRGATESEDQRLEEELLADEKECAEHIMLVDLHRNDIGRVCEPGSVEVDELMTVERYSHVMHIVSNVRGRLQADKDQFDVLRAAFPAGTVSGAPKIRAMEIIEELEPVKRGPYGGAIGYFSFSGAMDTCITLRTFVVKGDTAYLQVGSGIVADSDPDAEYDETMAKAGALLEALRLAEEGLV